MVKTAAAVILVSLVSLQAFGQVRRGTIAVVYYTPSKVIIAADSRLTFDNGVINKHNDGECKVAALGNEIVFVSAGFDGYDRTHPGDLIPSWRGTEEAHRAYVESSPKHSLWSIAAGWGELVRRRISALNAVDPRRLAKSAEGGLLTSAIFAGTATGKKITVLLVQIKISESSTGSTIDVAGPKEISPDTCPPCSLGKGQIFTEFLEKTTERARDEAARWKIRSDTTTKSEFDRWKIVRLVDLTILLHPDQDSIGGYIDALELKRGGSVKWIQHKPQCLEH